MLVILFALEYVIDTSPDSLLLFRGVGYPLVIIVITLILFVPKVIMIFTNEEALDYTNSSITESINNSVSQSQSYHFLRNNNIIFLNHI